MTKRDFLKLMSLAAVWKTGAAWASSADKNGAIPGFWDAIRADYDLKPDYINLENGYYSIQSQPVLKAYQAEIERVNREGSYYMRTTQAADKSAARDRLATYLGCAPETLIITRNTTESLDLVISGKNWKAGDEVVFADQDYGAMRDQFKLMEKRYGVVCRVVTINNHPNSDEEIVQAYKAQFSDKTKLVLISHIINITGQILPVRKIADAAKEIGAEVMVDGAHAVAHFAFKLTDLNCDYYGSSLHKWTGVPLGAGILYVAPGKAGGLWPLFGEEGFAAGDIRRLNHTGTHPVATDLAIKHALDYQEKIGLENKEKRLRFLHHYWSSALRKDPKGFIFNTPEQQYRYAGIGNVGIEGINPGELAAKLLKDYKIWTVAIDTPTVKGVRITPHVYTTTDELDALVQAMIEIRDKHK